MKNKSAGQPYELQVCNCEHVKQTHLEGKGACQVSGCSCKKWRKQRFDDSKLGRSMANFLSDGRGGSISSVTILDND